MIHRIAFAGLLLLSAGIFLVGINWGLPSHRVDPFLFGDQPVWNGAKIAQLAGAQASADLGADVDRNPVARSDQPVQLNATDAQRAEIIRRYRLFTYQPDEMITMMALASMSPARRDFDPKLYQYGGLWIYPVGALIKIFPHPQASQTFYLDHPEAFAKFYLAARLYCVAWGIVGTAAIFWIARRAGTTRLTAGAAAICFACMPVVANMAHEAKPHLPAAVLVLLAIVAATKFVETKLRRWHVLAAVCCGAAGGMVLSAMAAPIILLVMVLAAPIARRDRAIVLASSLVLAADVYFMTNPYVLIHLIGSRVVLLSNLRNSQAMYSAPPSLPGILNAIKLIGEGATPLLAIGGFVAMLLFVRRKRVSAIGWLFAAAAVAAAVPFFAFATGKPAEYARFALLPDVALMLAAIIGVEKFITSLAIRRTMLALFVASSALYAISYDWHFARDSMSRTTRQIQAERLRTLQASGANSLALAAEPAPYSLPPVDLFKWKLLLLPRGEFDATHSDVAIRTVDEIPSAKPPSGVEFAIRPRLLSTPMCWAAKPYELQKSSKLQTPSSK